MGEGGKRAWPLYSCPPIACAATEAPSALAIIGCESRAAHATHLAPGGPANLVLSESATRRDFAFVSTSPPLSLVAFHLSTLNLADAAGRSPCYCGDHGRRNE